MKYHVTKGRLIKKWGEERVVVPECPICHKEHLHGVLPEEKKLGWLIRYSHCESERRPDPPYFIHYDNEYYLIRLRKGR